MNLHVKIAQVGDIAAPTLCRNMVDHQSLQPAEIRGFEMVLLTEERLDVLFKLVDADYTEGTVNGMREISELVEYVPEFRNLLPASLTAWEKTGSNGAKL